MDRAEEINMVPRLPEHLKKVLNKPKPALEAAKFMVRTGVLGQFTSVLQKAAPDEDPD